MWDGEKSCLVGHALVDLGVPIDTLEEWETTSGPDAADVLLADLGITGDSDVVDRILRIQNRQDRQVPWGTAVDD